MCSVKASIVDLCYLVAVIAGLSHGLGGQEGDGQEQLHGGDTLGQEVSGH